MKSNIAKNHTFSSSDWPAVCLGDLVSIKHGYAFKGGDFSEDIKEGSIVVTIGNFDYSGGFRFNSTKLKRCRTEAPVDYVLKAGDILLAMTCQTSGGEILGIPGVVPNNNETYLHNQRLGKVVYKTNSLDSKYLYWLCLTREFNHHLYTTATGTKILHTAPKRIESYKFKCPPFTEQKAIAHILGSLDDKIELNRQMNETLETMAQALFKSWFVDFDPVIDNTLAAGHTIPDVFAERAAQRKAMNKNEAINPLFPDGFEYTEEMGWIPEGWKTDAIDKCLSINPRITLKKGTPAKFADMKALPTNGFSINDVITKEYSGGAKFENGDVLFARITPCLENGKTGIADFLKDDEVGFGSTEFIIMRGKNGIKTAFVACLARNQKFRIHAQQSMVGSSGRQRVQNSCFSDFYLALPESDELLKEFESIAQPNFEKVKAQSLEANTLAKLRNTLLPKLLSGELRIPDAEKLIEEATASKVGA